MTDEVLKITDEIMAYIESQESISYYDLEEYAYDNKPEWIPMFQKKNYRAFLSEYLRSRRRMKKVKYPRDRFDSMMAAARAKTRYYKRMDEASCKGMEEDTPGPDQCTQDD